MTDLITPALVRLHTNSGGEKHDAIRALAAVVVDAGRGSHAGRLGDDAVDVAVGAVAVIAAGTIRPVNTDVATV